MSLEHALIILRGKFADELVGYVERYHAAGGCDVEVTPEYVGALAELSDLMESLSESPRSEAESLSPSCLRGIALDVLSLSGDEVIGFSPLPYGFRLYLRRGGFMDTRVERSLFSIQTYPRRGARPRRWTGARGDVVGMLCYLGNLRS